MINSGRVLRPQNGVGSKFVRGWLMPLVLLTLITQAAVAQVQLEQVSARTFRVAGPNGVFRTVPDQAAAGQVLVRMARTARPGDLDRVLAATDTQIIRQYASGDLFLLKLPAGQGVNEGIAAIERQAGVGVASADRLKYCLRVPNDTRYGEQYHWPLIKAEQAWDVQTGSAAVVVAIVDSGVDLDHPDLQSRIWLNTDEIGGDFQDNDGNGYVDDVNGWDFVNGNNNPNPNPTGEPLDDWGVSHGSHCAGIVGAATNNTEGVAGHDWNCRIMPLQVMTHEGYGFDSWIIAGIEYAMHNGAKVVSLSIGGGWSDPYTDLFVDAVEMGVTIVAAAGNEYWQFTDDPGTWMSPVCNDGPMFTDNNVIGVGATDSNDRKADFSNYDASSRSFVDVMAPGVNILSTVYYDPDDPGLGFDHPYEAYDGTSMACPVTAGLVALVLAHFPHYTPAGITDQIRAAADNIDAENPNYIGMMGAGRINSQNCLQDVPPAAPRTVMAYDTPEDNGNSITVAWSLSADDGKGFNDVIGYRVQRSDTGEDDTWVTQADLAAGTSSYIDSPVDNYIPYYYRVSVRDASTEVFSNPTMPAEARDDTAPPALEEGELIGGDVQGDNGGAISLSWTGYTPPGDFRAYRIWRAEEPFTDVSSLPEPLALLFDPNKKSFVDEDDPETLATEVVDGVEYYYAVTVMDSQPEPNEILEVNAVGPLVASPNFTFVYPPGLNMIAIGAMPHDTHMGAIFGVEDPADLALARWNPAGADSGFYVVYSETPDDYFLRQQLGRAYWYRSDTATVLNISGIPAPPGDVSVEFNPGWNQIGNSYTHKMSLEGATVTVFGTQMSLAQSNAAGYTRDYGWRYDPFTNSYRLVSPTMDFADHEVPKGEGFYFLAFESGTLQLPHPAVEATSTLRAPAPKPVVDDDHWTIQLVAKLDGAADTDNFIGVNPEAAELSGVVSPPLFEEGVDLAVAAGDENYSATSFVQSIAGEQLWRLRLTAPAGCTVQLSWPDLSQTPATCRLKLRDVETGRIINMRTSGGYVCQLGAEQTERYLEVITSEKGASALTVTGVRAQATRSSGSQIVFALSDEAAVDVEVLNIAGRCVRKLAGDQLLPAGANTVLWDHRADSGTRVPPGRYLVSVLARTEDGTRARALCTLRVQR